MARSLTHQRNEVTKRALRLEVGAEGGGFDKI